eukprot:1908796-Rhodomonas_salina.1
MRCEEWGGAKESRARRIRRNDDGRLVRLTRTWKEEGCQAGTQEGGIGGPRPRGPDKTQRTEEKRAKESEEQKRVAAEERMNTRDEKLAYTL